MMPTGTGCIDERARGRAPGPRTSGADFAPSTLADDLAALLRSLARVEPKAHVGAPALAHAGDRYRRAIAPRVDLIARLSKRSGTPGNGSVEATALRERFGGTARVLEMLRESPGGQDDSTERTELVRLAERAGSPDALLAACCASLLADALITLRSAGVDAPEFERLGSELLDALDVLCLDDADATLRTVEEYLLTGRARRARRLLRARLARAPGDAVAAARYARALAGRPDPRRTVAAFDAAIALDPNDAALLSDAARECARAGDADGAADRLERAATRAPDDAGIAAALARARTLAGCVREARAPDTMPALAPSEDERRAGRFGDDAVAVAARLFRKHGTLRLDGVFDVAVVEACRREFMARSARHFEGRAHEDALRIGDRRFQIGVELSGAFADPRFYANAYVLGVMRALLGAQHIIGSVVCATSLPGASDQHLHKDHRAPFTEHEDDEPPELPPVAVTLMLPLVALDEEIGTTLVRKGSHRLARRASARLASQAPVCAPGSCFLMDLSLSHQGQGNRTERVRPIVNMQYTRRWFVDNKNFTAHPPLAMPAADWARVPDPHRALLAWAAQPPARVGS